MTTAFYQWGAESKRRRLVEEEARAGFETEITEYGIPLALVTYLKYLGRIITNTDDEWPAVVSHLHKASHK